MFYNDASTIIKIYFLKIFPQTIIDRLCMKISRKIAVIGTARSGKTVFLTSLINHLKEHNKMDFIINPQKNKYAEITNFKEKSIKKHLREKFNYSAYRSALVHDGIWPRKTTDTAHFICDYKRSDWKYNRNKLHFFDIPGERLADVAIAENKDFGEWSDYMINYLESEAIYRELSEDYLRMQKEDYVYPIYEEKVLLAYRKSLAGFVLAYKPMVSPSTFLLDQNGGTPVKEEREAFLIESQGRVLGLLENGKRREFAPLSEHFRKNNTQVTKLFAKNYKAYRNKIVLPLFADLKSSKRLIILVDIPSLLNGGVGMYNDNREIIELLFSVLSPESLLWRILTSAVKIDRVAFVATKSDSVHPLDVEDGKLMRLLTQMTEKFSNNLNDDVSNEWFVCSAVVSAKVADGEYMMRGNPDSDNPEKEHVYKVSTLPNGWPKDWQHRDYSFPEVLPRVPANKGIAPEHQNLDKIFAFITED